MATTATSDYWNGLRTSLTGLGIDVARSRLVDVETKDSDKNIRDATDVKLGEGIPRIAGMSLLGWAAIAGVIVVGVVLLKRWA